MLHIENIKKSFGKKQVLKNITFSAEKGNCIGILGANGCGKSTLFSIIAGVLKAQSGRIMYGADDLLKNTKLRSKVLGYVPQGTPLIEELNAYDNLLLWYRKKDLKDELINGVPAMLGIPDFLKTPVCKMSGGMKKRLSIACATAGHPDILILDEPSAALDLVCKKAISDYLTSFKNNGGTVIIATHEVQELAICDKVYILKDGVLAPFEFDGNIDKLAAAL